MDIKEKEIQNMFANISKKYDFLNHFLSLGQDIYWRKKVAEIVNSYKPEKVIDIACGTCDLAIEINKKTNKEIFGVDFCYEMLEIAKEKTKKVLLINGDATELPLKNNVFDVVTIAFGIRNIPERKKALNEFYRILNRDGILIILEFSIPNNLFFRFYFKKILPLVAGFFSDKKAYTYLPESVSKFPKPIELAEEIKKCGFASVKIISLSLGTVKIYICKKKGKR